MAPLEPGVTGIDPVSGTIVGAEGRIVPSLTKSEFAASPLFTRVGFSPRERGERIMAGVPLTLGGVVFHPALRFDEQRLTEVWLEGPGVTDAHAWLDARLPSWQGVFAWGTVNVEGDVGGGAIVVRYSAAASGHAREAP